MENNSPFSEYKEKMQANAEQHAEEAQVAEAVVNAPAEPVVEPVAEPVVEAPVVEAPVVEAPAAEEPVQALGFSRTGAISSLAADGPKKKISNAGSDLGEKVALHSTKSVRWEEVGSISKGYNIVTKAQAEKWLTRGHVRIASPEEVQKAFG
jgi:hypothetical protein